VEKVCLAWWRAPDDEPEALLDRLLPALSSDPVRAATLHVEADHLSADVAALRLGAAPDGRVLTALAAVWVDSYQDLPDLGADQAWLVCESVPQPYGAAFTWQPGERSPGLSMVTLLDKPAGMEEAEFYRCWHGLHRATTAECHPFTSYVRNEVARALTKGAPRVRGIVTESAPDVGDFLDPHRFYRSGGNDEQLRANQRRVFGEVSQFIDLATIQVAPMSEYVVRRLAPTSP
jgi:hypothetical protein